MPPITNTKSWAKQINKVFNTPSIADMIICRELYKEWLEQMCEYYRLPRWKRLFTKVPQIPAVILESQLTK